MTVVSMTYGRPAAVTIPPIGAILQRATSAVLAILKSVDRWLDHRDEDGWGSDQVMAWARRIEDTDPGFASDLRSAALRADIG